MSIKLICLDADDTLWHNMRHFNATEEALLGLIEPFASREIARQRLNECEARNLKLYGYGAKSFTLSMIETATELAGDPLPKSLITDLLAAGRALLSHPVELFDGIAETLERLAETGRLVLMTKGDLLHQEAKLAASGLGDRFGGIEIVNDKTPDKFQSLFGREGVVGEEVVMAGDSLRSDIHPALAAGAWAAFIPQEGAWAHESADKPADHPRFRQLDRLAELPAWIETIG